MRSFTCLTALTLALALGACGGEGDDTTTTNTTKTTPSTMSEGTTTAMTDATTDATTTSPTTSDDTTTDVPTTDGTTTAATDGTTTAATDGTTTAGTDGTTTADTDGTTGGGADLYGPCAMMMPPCEGAQDCLMVTDVEGNFCSPKCSMDMACPSPPAGVTAMPQCVLTAMGSMDPTNCALICNPMGMGECPDGMTCKPIQGVGVCSAP